MKLIQTSQRLRVSQVSIIYSISVTYISYKGGSLGSKHFTKSKKEGCTTVAKSTFDTLEAKLSKEEDSTVTL